MPHARLLPLHLLGICFLAPSVRFRYIVDRSGGRRGVLQTLIWRGRRRDRRAVGPIYSLVIVISRLAGFHALLVARGSGLALLYVRFLLSGVERLPLACLTRSPEGGSLLGGISERFLVSAGYNGVLATLASTRISNSSVSCVLLCFVLSCFPYLSLIHI